MVSDYIVDGRLTSKEDPMIDSFIIDLVDDYFDEKMKDDEGIIINQDDIG